MNDEIVVRVELKTLRKGDYTVYVFQNLDSVKDDGSPIYYFITKPPNWGSYNLEIGDEGFLKFTIAVAGETAWFDHRNTREKITHRYSANYFSDFIELGKQVYFKQDKDLVITEL